MNDHQLTADMNRKFAEIVRVGKEAVAEAQEESRRLGVPNVYSFNGVILYEWPNCELRREDPWEGRTAKP
jgi:hypothetical protein